MSEHGPQVLVLRTAGTNCDSETHAALTSAGAACETLHWKALARDPRRLEATDLLVLPGGFSYGDDLAAGRVFARELHHRLGGPLGDFLSRGGHVLGICNGFQVLVELGWLEGPGYPASERGIALTDNASGRFECRWVRLHLHPCAAPWIRPEGAPPVLEVPIAHAEGRFVCRDASVLQRLRDRNQIAFTYTDAEGRGSETPLPHPWNPNGSIANIAGICDPTGRIVGLMPHPERNRTPWNHPRWQRLGPRREGEGLALFRRLVEHLRDSRTVAL